MAIVRTKFIIHALILISLLTAFLGTNHIMPVQAAENETSASSPLPTLNAWSSLGGGLNNIVYAMVSNGTDIYAAGQFTDAGADANADRIAKWNGTSWSPLGSGISNGQVNALAFNGSTLYVGGNFTNAGGISGANYIAQWDGSSWSTLGDGITNNVNAISVSGSNIYIAGNFTNAGVDVNADYIAKLDGGTWAALGATPLTGPVNGIAVAGASVYAGGDFLDVGGNTNIDRIALWDGTSWSPLGSGMGATVVSIALSGTDVYAAGLFNDAGGNPNADKIAKWDGTTWSSLGNGLNSFVNNVVINGSNIYAGGNFLNAGGDGNADYIARWNGSNWSALGTTPLTNTVSAIVINGFDLYVGGIFNDANGDSNGDKIALFQLDAAGPAVTSFTATSPTNSLNIPITAFTASDNIGVTGYQITESPTPPAETDAGWTASAPTTYPVASSGSYILYPWSKDAMGNVSVVYGSPASVTVDIDVTAPTVASFSAASPTNSLDIPITAFTASDNIGVTDYLITQSSTSPSAGDSGWTASAPTIYTVASSGSYLLYPWVKDAAGNVSSLYGSPASVTVDAVKPIVNSFSATSPSASLNIPITGFTATDNVAVTGYLITTSSVPPSAGSGGWTASAPTTYAVASSGSYTIYPWAKDASGNISPVYGSPASVSVDNDAPTITAFSVPAASNSLDIAITTLSASDNTGVTDYLITESSTPPSAGAAGWTASAPTTYAVASSGLYTLYPWAKDAMGHVSAVYGSPASVSVDNAAPNVVSIARASTNPSGATSVNFTVTFSESVTAVDLTDFSLATTGVSGAALSGVSGSGSSYTVTVTTGSGNGSIHLDVLNDGTIQDLALNPLSAAFTSGESYTVIKPITLSLKSVAANDGWILESAETSGKGGTLNSTATNFLLGDDLADRQYRAILHFDTSLLPDTAVITSATLKIKKQGQSGSNPFSILGNLRVDMRKPAFGTAALALTDFKSAAGQNNVSTFGVTPVANWYSAILNSTGNLYINRTGSTQFRLYFTTDDNNDNGNDFMKFYSGNAGVASHPQLVIEYYVP